MVSAVKGGPYRGSVLLVEAARGCSVVGAIREIATRGWVLIVMKAAVSNEGLQRENWWRDRRINIR